MQQSQLSARSAGDVPLRAADAGIFPDAGSFPDAGNFPDAADIQPHVPDIEIADGIEALSGYEALPVSEAVRMSLCMIVKDEEELLFKTIESAKAYLGIDDIVVADTGSTDRTKEIAIACGARVFDFEWCDDFSAARNFAAEMAENDWIFYLDADEEVVEADMDEVNVVLHFDNCVGIISMHEMSDNTVHGSVRLYNRRTHSFIRSIHENLEPADGTELRYVRIPVHINHWGYVEKYWQGRGKYERYVSLLEKELEKNPDDPFFLYSLGKSHFMYNSDLEKACECFRKVLSICGGSGLRYVYNTVECYGYALINTGRYDDALDLIAEYYPRYESDPNFRFLAAHVYQNNGMFIEAVECYESCIGANINDTRGIASYLSYYNIGVILECLEMREDAAEMYKNCGDYEPALERLREIVTRSP